MRILSRSVPCLILACITLPTGASMVTFSSLQRGVYRTGSYQGEELFATEDSIDMRLRISQPGGNGSVSVVDSPAIRYFPDQFLLLEYTNVDFDLNNTGFDVTSISFEYLQLESGFNFSVNGMPLHLGKLINIPKTWGQVSVQTERIEAPLTGFRAKVTMTGPIHSFVVGGKRGAIDNVIVLPEPVAALLLPLGLAAFRRRR